MECLNTYFSVVYYNGGPMKGLTGIQKLFGDIHGKGVSPHSTRSGQLFDVVLEYNNPAASSPEENVFNLNYLIATCLGEEIATAPLKSGVFFVSNSKNIEYSAAFDKITAENYKDAADLPAIPSGFLFNEKQENLVGRAINNSTGKYLHIKLTSSWGDDNNIDLGMFKIIGSHGNNAMTSSANTSYSSITEEELLALCDARFLKHTPRSGVVSALHDDYADTIHTDNCILLVSTLNVDATVSKAHADRSACSADERDLLDTITALQLSAKDLHNAMLHFFIIDPSTNKRIVQMLLPFLGEGDAVEIPPTVSTSQNGPYDLPAGLPIKVVHDDGDDDVEIQRPIVDTKHDPMGAFSLKSGKAFLVCGLSNSNKSVKFMLHEQTLEQMHAKNVKDIEESQLAFIQSDDSLLSTFVRCFNLVCNEHARIAMEQSFGDVDNDEDLEILMAMKKMGLHDRKKHGDVAESASKTTQSSGLLKLLKVRSLSAANATAMHPVYTNLTVITHDNFNDTVVNHNKPIIFTVLDMSMSSSVSMTQKLLEFSEIVRKFKLDVRVGIFDTSFNDFPSEHHHEELYDCVLLYTKTARVNKAVKGKKPAAETPFCFDDKKKGVYRYALLYSDVISDEDRETMDALAEELGEEQENPTPAIADVVSFIIATNPKIITLKPNTPDTKKFSTVCKSMNELIDNWSYCEAVVSTVLPSLAERMRVKHSGKYMTVEKGSIAAGYIEKLKQHAVTVQDVRSKLVLPYGRCKVYLTGHAETSDAIQSGLMLNAQEEEITTIHADIEQCVAGITPILQSVAICKAALEGVNMLLHKYPTDWKNAIKAYKQQFEGFGVGYSKIVANLGLHSLTLPIPEEVAAELKAVNEVVEIPEETDVVTFSPADMKILGEKMEKCREAMEKLILSRIMTESNTVYGEKIPLLRTDEVLERFLQGYEMLQAPKKVTIASRKKYADARSRLLCIMVTSLKDDTHIYKEEIAQCMQSLSEKYATLVNNASTSVNADVPALKNVQFARILVEDYPEIQETLNITGFPTLVFTQDMGEADDLRSTGAPGKEIVQLLTDSVDSMQLLDNENNNAGDEDDEDLE